LPGTFKNTCDIFCSRSYKKIRNINAELTEEISNTAPKIRKNETTKTNAEIEQKKQKFSI
jgi:hypothetical protein